MQVNQDFVSIEYHVRYQCNTLTAQFNRLGAALDDLRNTTKLVVLESVGRLLAILLIRR